MATPQLFTSSYRTMRDREPEDGVQGVRITVGLPHFWREAYAWPLASQLAPYGLFKIEDRDEFAARYIARLERHGVEAIRDRFAEIAEERGAHTLVLACFEPIEEIDAGKTFCHRHTWSRDWWRRKTGQEVPELRVRSSTAMDGRPDRDQYLTCAPAGEDA